MLFAKQSTAQSPKYLSVKAMKGDGILVLLNRYQLDKNDCALNKFCTLNKLKENDGLQLDKNYLLPILTYTYNNSSIRSTIDSNDWNLAKEIERYNDLMLELGRKEENYRKGKRELWVPAHLTSCSKDRSEFVPKDVKYPIFGSKHETVKIQDKKLAGAVYYIVAGHGGPDPGAMATYKGKNLCEDEYAYDISLRLARNLIEHGAIVYMIIRDNNDGIRDAEYLIPDTDERCWPNSIIPLKQKSRLEQRSSIINKLYEQNRKKGIEYQRLIEIHVDSRVKSMRIDLFFYHYPSSKLGKSLATLLHNTMKKKYAKNRRNGKYNGTVSPRDLHMLREVKPVPVFIEVGNIQNVNDQKRILYSSNRQALADWLEEGLLKDY